MNRYYLFFMLLLGGVVHSQDSISIQTYRSALGIGEELKFGGRSIRFKELVADSRCPRDVTCIRAGKAKVLVEIFENGKICGEEELIITERNDLVSLIDFFPEGLFFLNAVSLRPYPEINKRIKPSDYSLQLEVREKVQ